MTRRTLAFALTLWFVFPTSAQAQAPSESPESVVERYRSHLVAGDWSAAAALVHPDDLAALRSTFDDVAALDGGPELLAEIGGEGVDLSTSSDVEVLGAYLRWQMAVNPGAQEAMARMEWRLDETLIDGETAVVVAEASLDVDGEDVTMPDTTPLRLSEGEWRIDVSQLVVGLRSELGLGGRTPQGDPGRSP